MRPEWRNLRTSVHDQGRLVYLMYGAAAGIRTPDQLLVMEF